MTPNTAYLMELETAIRRLAAITDIGAFATALGWLPSDLDAVNAAYELLAFGHSITDAAAIMRLGYTVREIQTLRELMGGASVPLSDVLMAAESIG